MAEQITIVIRGGDDRGGILTVEDAMHQVLDSLKLVMAAASDEARKKVDWRLVSATVNSPVTMIVEAHSQDAEIPALEDDIHEAKVRFGKAFQAVFASQDLPSWMTQQDRRLLKKILKRNLDGVVQTEFHLLEDEEPVQVDRASAQEVLGRMAREESNVEKRYQRSVWGEVEGNIVETTTYNRKPAFKLKHRLSGENIVCVIPNDLVDEIGDNHSWGEVWRGQHCLVSGEIKRKSTGEIAWLKVREIIPVKVEEIGYDVIDRISHPDYTRGKSPIEYLDELWGV